MVSSTREIEKENKNDRVRPRRKVSEVSVVRPLYLKMDPNRLTDPFFPPEDSHASLWVRCACGGARDTSQHLKSSITQTNRNNCEISVPGS